MPQIRNDISLHMSRDLANKIVKAFTWNNLMQIASITDFARDRFYDKSVRQHESLDQVINGKEDLKTVESLTQVNAKVFCFVIFRKK